MLALAIVFGAVAVASTTGILSADEINAIMDTTTDPAQVTSPFIQVADHVRNSIVGVNNYQLSSTRNYGYGYGYGFGFGGGNGYGNQQTEKLAATGSGVVVSQFGHIVTNYHVVEGSSRLTVTIASSEEEFDAELVVYDADLDIAVLHVNNLPLASVPMGDSDQLQVGEWAIVIGNPLGEEFARTVTVGIVSALDREIVDTTYDKYGRKTNITNSMIQVDAAINSGNSGGGMFNTLGQLMGIPARKYSSSGYSTTTIDNIGMCIPINVAKPLIRTALEQYTGDTAPAAAASENNQNRPMLGVTVTTMSSSAREKLPQGALVTKVEDSSNAQRGGILPGDIIVEVNETVITSNSQLVSVIQSLNEGDEIKVKVFRAEGLADQLDASSLDLSKIGDGEYIDLTVTMLMNATM